ncbi:MAG: L-glutamate gamma-semialdehyde dehydrogenase [Pseudomonadota bacterium]
MTNSIFNIPTPGNEPIFPYNDQDFNKKILKDHLELMSSKEIEIPLIIAGEEIKTGKTATNVMPHNHKHVLCTYHQATAKEINMAIKASMEAKKSWEKMAWQDRASIFLRAAELLANKYRPILNAATMLGQSKNVYQAEIDSACELIDFWRFNPKYMEKLYAEQPPISPVGMWNRVEARALEGFIFAITPFNFTSIAGNLPTAPAMMGNTVVWKPASSAVYSAYYIMQILKEAGLPDGVINFIPCRGSDMGNTVVTNPDFAGVHFTGSTEVFQGIWKDVGLNIDKFKTYPRIVGETGGKDFIFAHKSADEAVVQTAMVRGAFEYQGQKCSAASRAYIPESIWNNIKSGFLSDVESLKMGDVMDFRNFVNAVIDKSAFKNITSYIDYAKNDPDSEIIAGGEYDDSVGYFIKPTVILAKKPDTKTMQEEIFGPVLTLYVYNDADFEKTLDICDNTSPYALTGAILANEREAINIAYDKLTHAAGNFYINDKPTGAVVGQQPFGGSRASGTNDKAGSMLNLQRWVSQRTVKENFNPPTSYEYPFMEAE